MGSTNGRSPEQPEASEHSMAYWPTTKESIAMPPLPKHPYYATTYTQHIVRASGEVVTNRGVPFTELHAAEVGSVLYKDELYGIEGIPLYKAVDLVAGWNQRYEKSKSMPDGSPHFPRFFYTIDSTHGHL